MKDKLLQLSRSQAEDFYKEHIGKPFFEKLLDFMTSGKVFIQVLEGEDAIEKNRALMGLLIPN